MELHPERSLEARSFLIGRVAALINDVPTAKEITDRMVEDASRIMLHGASMVTHKSKL